MSRACKLIYKDSNGKGYLLKMPDVEDYKVYVVSTPFKAGDIYSL